MAAVPENLKKMPDKEMEYLLGHKSRTIDKSLLQIPSPDFIDKVFKNSNRNPQVLRNLASMFNNGGFTAINFGKSDPSMYEKLSSNHPIDLCRYQVANCYMGRIGLINSGGESKGEGDLEEAVKTAIINKRGGGMGLIVGRKAFQRPMKAGVKLLNLIQDVYLNEEIGLA